jgi:hypothetical protein
VPVDDRNQSLGQAWLVGGGQPDQAVEHAVQYRGAEPPVEQDRDLLGQLVRVDDRRRRERGHGWGRQVVAPDDDRRHRRRVPVLDGKSGGAVADVHGGVPGGGRDGGGDLRAAVPRSGELVEPGQLGADERLVGPRQHRAGRVEQAVQVESVDGTQGPLRHGRRRRRGVREQPEVAGGPVGDLRPGRREEVVQRDERPRRGGPLAAQQPAEASVEQRLPIEPPLGRERREGLGKDVLLVGQVRGEPHQAADPVDLEEPGQQRVEERVDAEPVDQRDTLPRRLGPVESHQPGLDEPVDGGWCRPLGEEDLGDELHASVVLRPHLGRQPVGQVGHPGDAAIPGHREDRRCRVGAQADAPPAEHRGRRGGRRQGGDRDNGQAGRLAAEPPVVTPLLDPRGQLGADLLAGRRVKALHGGDHLVDLAPPDRLEKHRGAFCPGHDAAIDTARACLQGPRPPWCRPHHGHEHVNPPPSRIRTR